MPKRPKRDPADDEPKVGDIWKLVTFDLMGNKDNIQYYLLLDNDDFSSSRTFTMLCLNDGEHRYQYMNFELDDWRFVC